MMITLLLLLLLSVTTVLSQCFMELAKNSQSLGDCVSAVSKASSADLAARLCPYYGTYAQAITSMETMCTSSEQETVKSTSKAVNDGCKALRCSTCDGSPPQPMKDKTGTAGIAVGATITIVFVLSGIFLLICVARMPAVHPQ